MKKGQTVLQAAQKLARRHVRDSLERAIDPISDEVKQYLSTLVQAEMPEVAEEILMLDVRDIVATALDFV
jgi:hypothetical protein